jgi:DUF1009 family protein
MSIEGQSAIRSAMVQNARTAATPPEIALIAGKGVYPRLLAESARMQGVSRIFALAFRGETDRVIEKCVDRVEWVHLGQVGAMIEALRHSGMRHVVMAGQVTPTSLFRVRIDAKARDILRRLPVRNAETIFGAVAEELAVIGIELLPASSFMEAHMPQAGILSSRAPSAGEQHDIEIGFRAAKLTSSLDIGQTVVVKEGTILAVEAFEGTDETMKRAGKLGGAGAVVVKVAKPGHDMRFDIPVIGRHTIKVLRSIRAAALALEAGRAILLERELIIAEANRMGLCLSVVAGDPDSLPGE